MLYSDSVMLIASSSIPILGDTEYNHASKTFMTSFWNGEIIKD
jgi:predicted membrane channel-forming protein YqfA (hemolysin III family)